MLIRLLQHFDSMSLDASAQPPETRPPAEWKTKEGRSATEQFFPKLHLTMYSHVSEICAQLHVAPYD